MLVRHAPPLRLVRRLGLSPQRVLENLETALQNLGVQIATVTFTRNKNPELAGTALSAAEDY